MKKNVYVFQYFFGVHEYKLLVRSFYDAPVAIYQLMRGAV